MTQQIAQQRPAGSDARRGVLAGIGAALVMAAVMSVLRVTTAVPSLAEIIAEGIIGLMPAAAFSAILDALQKAAKPTLYVGIFAGMLAVGGLLGRGFSFGEPTWGRALRLAAVVWAAVGVVVLPLLGVGLFGSAIRADLVTLAVQLAVVVLSFAAALLLILRATEPAADASTIRARRRAALAGLAGGLVAVAAGGAAWRAIVNATAGSPVSTANVGEPASGAAAGAAAPPSAPAPASAAAGAPAPSSAAAASSAPAAQVPSGGTAPARGIPRLDAPPVPMSVAPNQVAPAPFNLAKLSPEVLTAADFYTVSKNLIDPAVDVDTWSLRIDGLVERPTTYVYADLTALPVHSDYYTLQCISNTVGGELWGNAHWTGVRLVELLGRVGLKPGVRKVVFHADDGYTDSIPLDAALRADTLLAYAMNGEPLTKEHGYPARLLVPGIYGMKNVKWITRIELVDYDFKGYWMQRGWSDTAAYNTATRIDTPATRATVPPGEVSLGGVTFAGFRGIDMVEVSLDDGQTWEPATLKPALSLNAWNLWVFQKDLAAGTYMVKARAVDGTGEVQTFLERDPLPDGATGYHSILLRVG